MKRPYRILLADDSVTVRRLLSETLSRDPQLEVCWAARDGREAAEQFVTLKPDVVLLDVEMPVMDGIEATAAIRQVDPRVPIVMFSSLASAGVNATLDALQHGATDYVTKPTRVGHLQSAIRHIEQELIPKLKHWGEWHHNRYNAKSAIKPAAPNRSGRVLRRASLTADSAAGAPVRGPSRIDLVAIGASTGGPNALAEVLSVLPKQFPASILITQHMPPLFTTLLADRLNQVCPLTVREAVDGAEVLPGEVWLAPGDRHLVVERDGTSVRLRLDPCPPEDSCRSAVDVMFRSIASVYLNRTLAVVLTGMGTDGIVGCRHLREQGSRVLVQDQASSVVWGMPRAVVEAGLAERILPLNELGSEINRLVQSSHQTCSAAG